MATEKMAIARKKVIVRSFGGGVAWGYLAQDGFVEKDGVDLLDSNGKVLRIILNEIKTIATVKDFNLEDEIDPERVGRKSFLGRPRSEGLWLKVEFRDGDLLEGMAYFDVVLMDTFMVDRGFRMVPPDARSNTQSLFVPRSAVTKVEVLGYVGAPGKKKAKPMPGGVEQSRLFEE
jgi:hypothetical protein